MKALGDWESGREDILNVPMLCPTLSTSGRDAIPLYSKYHLISSILLIGHVLSPSFSHHRVTAPPPGWINAAHRQGVKILGVLYVSSFELK